MPARPMKPGRHRGCGALVAHGKSYCEQHAHEAVKWKPEPVLKCTPVLKGNTYQLAAAVGFTHNAGTGVYCSSMTAKRFNRGDWKGACRAMNEADNGRQQWVTAGCCRGWSNGAPRSVHFVSVACDGEYP
jgi:GH24 family phage-related lysozyme (muramidase)